MKGCTLMDCLNWTDADQCTSEWPLLGTECCASLNEPVVRAHRCMSYHPKGWDGTWLWPAKKGEAPIAGEGTSAAECPGAMGLPSCGSRGGLVVRPSRIERVLLWFNIRPLSRMILGKKARMVAKHIRG